MNDYVNFIANSLYFLHDKYDAYSYCGEQIKSQLTSGMF